MTQKIPLSEQQKHHIEATLKRITEGLAKKCDPDLEPSHIFNPEAFSEKRVER
ncbi:hypothetical protein J0X12_02825 [Sneathiella sp. CAU 1612]|jgi:hypothetical protein|uniref:Uncharacterized protein n=1 Tax=Sneathiella sedimenti TaxID=2816034 RepID=A0ABS3F257_9PROT|nr:hypothetical protein [Sneathiella sedimenti]MBO0332530.1 hypothetical protein [Sneathiella sedimenti]